MPVRLATTAAQARRALGLRAAGPSVCSVLALEHFRHPAVIAAMREIYGAGFARLGPGFPRGREYRKHWEIAMAARALLRGGALRPDAEVLGVGAGTEPTLFWLTRRVRRVYATDRYLDAGVWREFAPPSMLGDPGAHWPFAWNPRRLVVQHMDALDLRHPDSSFDAVFSSSSVEHFGGLDEVRRSLDEAFRVLKPGGVLSIATEFRIAGPPPGLPGCLMFDAGDVREHLIGDRDWAPLAAPDLRVTAATRRAAVPAEAQMADIEAHFAAHGAWVLHELEFSSYPQVSLRLGDHVWTSVHLALRKGG